MEEKKNPASPAQKSGKRNHRRRHRHPAKKTGDTQNKQNNIVQEKVARPEVSPKEELFPKATLYAETPTEEKSQIPPPADVLECPIFAPVTREKSDVTVEVVGIRFKTSGKTYFFAPGEIHAQKGDYAIVETARGAEIGEVTLANTFVSESDVVPPLRPVIRLANEADLRHQEENREKEKAAFKTCVERIAAHKLDMKLVEAQYTFDNSKLLFYFTSAGRVDFRDLVKDLASHFRTRIELRQIGIRDEAKLLGGLGLCGRPLCCSSFLSDFGQVSIKMAKEQNLSLNSAKISGVCGRLMCCLRFEHETYAQEIKLTPPVDALVKTPDGNGLVTENSPLTGMVKVKLLDKPDNPPVIYHRDVLTVLQTKAKGGAQK